MADCDNVNRFLMKAGYRAVVPGREDFIYTATWLRQIARLLKRASDLGQAGKNPFNTVYQQWNATFIASQEHKLHMLAANLRVKLVDYSTEKPKDFCQLLFSDNLLSSAHACSKDDSTLTDEMNWLRRVDQSLPLKDSKETPQTLAESNPETNPDEKSFRFKVQESLQEQAKSNREFNTQLIENQQAILKTLAQGDKGDLSPEEQTYLNGIANCIFDPNKPAPKPGPNSDKSPAKPCMGISLPTAVYNPLNNRDKLFYIANDLLDKIKKGSVSASSLGDVLLSVDSRRYVVGLLLDLIYQEQKDVGFTIAEIPDNNKQALVIGVVGQETMQEISCENLLVYPTREFDRLDAPKAAPDTPNQKNSLDMAPKTTCGLKRTPSEMPPGSVLVGDPRIAVDTILRAAWEQKRALALEHPAPKPALFDRVIVMAQMPHTEADELGAHVRADIADLYKDKDGNPLPDSPVIDLILSEAQPEHVSPTRKIDFNRNREIPVLTPIPAYTLIPMDESSPDGKTESSPISMATISDRPNDPAYPQHLENTLNLIPPAKKEEKRQGQTQPPIPKPCKSAACLLETELEKARTLDQLRNGTTPPQSDLAFEWGACRGHKTCQNSFLMQYLLRQLQRSSKTDVVALKRRDFYFEGLGPDTGYELCDEWVAALYDPNKNPRKKPNKPDPKDRSFYRGFCRLHVALDRVLWKGDYSERVMVDGATLTALMKTSQQQANQDQTLLARDLNNEWLMTYGIVTKPPTNLAAASSGPESFSVPGLDGCNPASSPLVGKADSAADPPYCVDGHSVASDGSYWLSTSDQLAQDTTVYSALGTLAQKNTAYVERTRDLFITTEIAEEVLRDGQQPASSNLPANAPESSLALIENYHQARSLAQLDFTKLVAGYSFTNPSLSASKLATYLDGVTNSTATNPKSQELDLEAATRLTYAPLLSWLTLGTQSDAEFDRKYTQNITGSPDTLAYSINTYSVGGFAQLTLPAVWKPKAVRQRLDKSTRNLSRWFLVVSPYQFQRQIAASYLAFPFYTPASGSSKASFSTTQFDNVKLPIPMGFSQRIGLRLETSGLPKWTPDPGSYVEIGPEYFVQNNVLSEVDLKDIPLTGGSTPYAVCPAIAMGVIFKGNDSLGNPFINCAKNDYSSASPQVPLNASSNIVPIPKTLHAGGFYWTSHVQKTIDARKAYSVSFDTAGDSYLLPGFVLSTQTRYALTTKLALNFKIIPSLANLTLSPTWSGFYYENQGDQGATPSRTSLITNGFSVSAKWYFARDAAVPFPKQGWFAGPASVDQTSSAKMK
jgi:hypothetical protein